MFCKPGEDSQSGNSNQEIPSPVWGWVYRDQEE